MKQEEIKTEYLTLLQKPFLTDKDIQRGKILVGMWKKSNRWNECLKKI